MAARISFRDAAGSSSAWIELGSWFADEPDLLDLVILVAASLDDENALYVPDRDFHLARQVASELGAVDVEWYRANGEIDSPEGAIH